MHTIKGHCSKARVQCLRHHAETAISTGNGNLFGFRFNRLFVFIGLKLAQRHCLQQPCERLESLKQNSVARTWQQIVLRPDSSFEI